MEIVLEQAAAFFNRLFEPKTGSFEVALIHPTPSLCPNAQLSSGKQEKAIAIRARSKKEVEAVLWQGGIWSLGQMPRCSNSQCNKPYVLQIGNRVCDGKGGGMVIREVVADRVAI